MPNWCHNRLVVAGPDNHLEAFCEAARSAESPLTFTQLVPEPENLGDRQRSPLQADLQRVPLVVTRATGAAGRTEGGAVDETQPIGLLELLALEHLGEPVATERLDWYAWHLHCWGTKWDAIFETSEIAGALIADPAASLDDGSVLRIPGQAVYGFLTAWSPPLPLIRTVAGDYPELRFTLRYAEAGNDFAGQLVVHRDEEIEDEQGDLSVNDVLSPAERWF